MSHDDPLQIDYVLGVWADLGEVRITPPEEGQAIKRDAAVFHGGHASDLVQLIRAQGEKQNGWEGDIRIDNLPHQVQFHVANAVRAYWKEGTQVYEGASQQWVGWRYGARSFPWCRMQANDQPNDPDPVDRLDRALEGLRRAIEAIDVSIHGEHRHRFPYRVQVEHELTELHLRLEAFRDDVLEPLMKGEEA